MSDIRQDRDRELGCWQLHRRVVELEDRVLAFYVRIIRPLRQRYGDEVLDIAEGLRLADGREAGLARRALLPDGHPATALRAYLDDLASGNWSRKLACVFCMPTPERLELAALHCPVGEAFRRMGEPEIGLSWCAFDFGFTPALGGGRLALVEPRHYHLGHGYCFQIHQAVDDPLQGHLLMAPERSGWRRYACAARGESPLGDLPSRARFFPNVGVDRPMDRATLETGIATLTRCGVGGFVRLVRLLAERFGDAAFDEVETLFAEERIPPAVLRQASAPAWRGWYWCG